MSLLQICQDAANMVGISPPASVVNAANSDVQIRRLLALANTEGRSLSRRFLWEALINEATFTTVADREQGDIDTIAPGFRRILNQTMWDRDTQEPVAGPLTPQNWQQQLAVVTAGPYYEYRIRGGKLLFDPEPVAGNDVAFEYLSENWCESASGTGQSRWQADNDVGILDEYLMTLGLRWRFLQAQGLDYGEAFREYEVQVNTAMGGDGGSRKLDMGGPNERQPVVRAPAGSWPV